MKSNRKPKDQRKKLDKILLVIALLVLIGTIISIFLTRPQEVEVTNIRTMLSDENFKPPEKNEKEDIILVEPLEINEEVEEKNTKTEEKNEIEEKKVVATKPKEESKKESIKNTETIEKKNETVVETPKKEEKKENTSNAIKEEVEEEATKKEDYSDRALTSYMVRNKSKESSAVSTIKKHMAENEFTVEFGGTCRSATSDEEAEKVKSNKSCSSYNSNNLYSIGTSDTMGIVVIAVYDVYTYDSTGENANLSDCLIYKMYLD